jgi:flagellar FliL protein
VFPSAGGNATTPAGGARVLDTFQVHLRELRAADLEGSAGLFRLREELTRRVNHAIAPAKIRAVLFREVVVQ